MPTEDLKALRLKRYAGSAELAAAAAQLVDELVPAQKRGSVTDLPDERTVRYYLAEGLISTVSEKQGTASLYGYRHLLQLLAIKRLQADYLPIRKIRELIENKTEAELEELLGLGVQPGRNPALEYLKPLLERPLASALAAEVSLFRRESSPEPPSAVWSRFEVEPGLELHIRDDYQPPTEAKERRRLGLILQHELNQRSQAPPDDEVADEVDDEKENK
jgi:DNA-binding transcriptional MerR regulator